MSVVITAAIASREAPSKLTSGELITRSSISTASNMSSLAPFRLTDEEAQPPTTTSIGSASSEGGVDLSVRRS